MCSGVPAADDVVCGRQVCGYAPTRLGPGRGGWPVSVPVVVSAVSEFFEDGSDLCACVFDCDFTADGQVVDEVYA